MKWLKENTRIRADMKFKGGSLRLTEPEIQDAPLVFMTRHDKDITVGRGLAKDGPPIGRVYRRGTRSPAEVYHRPRRAAFLR